jgi:hypothetical protein
MGRVIRCAPGASTALGLEVHRQDAHAAGRIRWRMTAASGVVAIERAKRDLIGDERAEVPERLLRARSRWWSAACSTGALGTLDVGSSVLCPFLKAHDAYAASAADDANTRRRAAACRHSLTRR